MSDLTLDDLRSGGQEFMEEVSREYYRAHAGLKSTAELQPIYERHARVLGDEALALARDAFIETTKDGPESSEERRSARVLLEWQVESQAARVLASQDEREIAWESQAVLRLADGSSMPYQRAVIALANSEEHAERIAIDVARATLVARELAPLKRERLEQERSFIEGLGIAPGYNATFQAVSGIDLDALAGECEGFLADTQAMWDEVHPRFLRDALGLDPGEATRADALALFRGRQFDRFFPSALMQRSILQQSRDMGMDPDAAGRVCFDVGEREGKRPRAFCAPVRVPDEVYLVMRPHGGQSDYITFLHELGHALHFAFMRPDLPFEFRWLGDNSVTESYAMLYDHFMKNRGWLLRYTELKRKDVDGFIRSAGYEELHFVRRYAAKLLYERDLYAGRTAWDSLPDLYVDRLSGATTFQYQRADAFVDVDPRFYAARYVRAWQLQALLAEALVDRFDEDWFRNPAAGPWIVEQLFAEGQRELGSELAERVSGRVLSFRPLISAIEQNLGGNA
ncbi:MAG: hypothetical protein ACRENI_07535 [Gemmatimonadaceae bacterium]